MQDAQRHQSVDFGRPPVRRRLDTTNRDARLAVAECISRIGPLRSTMARLRGLASKPLSSPARDRHLATCREIASELAAMTQTLRQTVEALPPQVAGHSRIVDVERALVAAKRDLSEISTILRDS